MGETFALGFFSIGMVTVVGVVGVGYFKNKFSQKFAWVITAIFLAYLAAFGTYRHLTTNVDEKLERASYIAFGIFHGIVAVSAISLACYMFLKAGKPFALGENYFRMHEKLSLLLVALWPLAFISGFVLARG
jgi:hypothetical protein